MLLGYEPKTAMPKSSCYSRATLRSEKINIRWEGFDDSKVKGDIKGSIFHQEIQVEASFQELDNNEIVSQATVMIKQ